MSSVTDCRPLRELIAEAKAEVTEEIEDSKEEEEEEEEPDTPLVHGCIAYSPALALDMWMLIYFCLFRRLLVINVGHRTSVWPVRRMKKSQRLPSC